MQFPHLLSVITIILSELKREIRIFFGKNVLKEHIGVYDKFRYPKEFTLKEFIEYIWTQVEIPLKKKLLLDQKKIED